MKILIVVESKHLGNTRKVAVAMSEVAPITITDIKGASRYDFFDYDIVGFGSGIYMGKHDQRLLKFVDSLCDKEAYTFVFSTSGGPDFEQNNNPLVDILKRKNKKVLGVFSCLGLDKFFILRLMGGMNKGHPNDEDLKHAQEFILGIIAKYQSAVSK